MPHRPHLSVGFRSPGLASFSQPQQHFSKALSAATGWPAIDCIMRSGLPWPMIFCYFTPAPDLKGERKMANLRFSNVLLVTLSLTAAAGCTKSTPETGLSGSAAPVIGSNVLTGAAESSVDVKFAVADAAESPNTLAPLEYSADPLEAEPQEAAPSSESADASDHYRQRVSTFADTASNAAWLLERHASTASFDEVCDRLKELLGRARSADEDDGFDVITQKANLILQRLRLGRTLLRQRDDLDDMSSPGGVKLLRDTYQACSRLAQDVQPEIADLRREVDVR
jgi:hypothetical protein